MGKIKMKMSNFKYRILKGIGSWFIKKSVIHVMKERKRETCGIFHKFNDHLFMEAIVTTKEPFLSGMSMKFWKNTGLSRSVIVSSIMPLTSNRKR